jgi:hypothetical protein
MALGGALLGQDASNVLSIRPPCDWDWEKQACRNTDTAARITWNDAAVSSLDTPEVKMTVNGNHVKVLVGSGASEIEVSMTMHGSWGGRWSYMNAHIKMPEVPEGMICGHCGNFNGDAGDDHMYKRTGFLEDTSKSNTLCDASVHCDDRFIKDVQFGSYISKDTWECEENQEAPDVGIEDCPEEVLAQATKTCSSMFAKVGKSAHHKGLKSSSLEDCVMDECFGEGMAKDDAEEFAEEVAAGM